MKKISILLIVLIISFAGYSQTSKDYYNSGIKKEKVKDYKGAIADYNLAIKINPKYTEAINRRNIVKKKIKSNNATITNHKKTIKSNQQVPEEKIYTEKREQDQYDVRKTRWGMTISEVVSSEYPLTLSEDNDNAVGRYIIYSLVELSYGWKAEIIYWFTNSKLSKVTYSIYGYNNKNDMGTYTHIIPLYDKIQYTNFVFEALRNKGMKCSKGWSLINNKETAYKHDYYNCNFDKETINDLEKAASENNSTLINITFSNERTDALISFNQYQNDDEKFKKIEYDIYKEKNGSQTCYYNIYYTINFTPTYKIKNEMRGNDF